MQTIEEYRKYTKQLEEEVGTWHRSYDALMVERNDLVKKVMHLESELDKANAIIETLPTQESSAEIDTLASGSRNLNEAIEAMAAELEELRKHELELDLAKAHIKELEAKNAKREKNLGELVKTYEDRTMSLMDAIEKAHDENLKLRENEKKLDSAKALINVLEKENAKYKKELAEMAINVAHLETELEQKEK